MPELPEVETIKRGLGSVLPSLIIDEVEIISPVRFAQKYQIGEVRGVGVKSVDRRAKVLIIHLANDKSLLFHLKMTGQLIYEDENDRVSGGHPIPPLNSAMPNNTTRVIFNFTDGSKLYFNDMRRFGWIFSIPTKEVHEFPFFATVGPEPFDPEFTIAVFKQNLLKHKNFLIKNALLDQTIVAGIGNIYADETLWNAKVHPKRKVESLSDKEILKIYHGLKLALETGIKHKGSSSKTYVNHKGERGTFLDYANAYHHTGLPCSRCGTIIVREKIGSRSAHYCPKCQKL